MDMLHPHQPRLSKKELGCRHAADQMGRWQVASPKPKSQRATLSAMRCKSGCGVVMLDVGRVSLNVGGYSQATRPDVRANNVYVPVVVPGPNMKAMQENTEST